jgi:hypothetical protein
MKGKERRAEVMTYRNADIHQKVRADKAVASLRRLIADGLLGQGNGVVDEKRLAEGESDETGAWRNGPEDGPFQNTIGCTQQRVG